MSLHANNGLTPKDVLDTRRRCFQTVLAASIRGAQYAKQHFRNFVSHPGVEGFDTYDHEFRLMCRVALDSKEADIPLETWSGIVCVLRYKQYHVCADGHYDFQLCRNGCLAKMGLGRLCKPEVYPYPPTLKYCSELQLQGLHGFLDDPVVQPGGEFMSAK